MLRRFYGVGLFCGHSYSRGHSRYLETIRKMTDIAGNKIGVSLEEAVDAIRRFADTSLAASWDNVGLLVEPTQPKVVSCILLTNDLTEEVMEEALQLNINLIVTYHPLIFAPLKSITTQSWKERIVARCLENKVAVYSPHTCFDSVQGGVNDWLAKTFELKSRIPILPDASNPTYFGMGRLCTLTKRITIDEAVNLVKQHTNLQHVRLARARGAADSYVKTVAVCAGSGTSVLKEVSADLYLTGEMLHHDVLDAVHRGIHVILTNHSDSERGYLKTFALMLDSLLHHRVKVCVSEADRDPLQTV